MKKILVALVLALAFCGTAFAETRTVFNFTIDVPADWVASSLAGYDVLSSPDGRSSILVAITLDPDRPIFEAAEFQFEQFGGTGDIQPEGDGYVFDSINPDGENFFWYTVMYKASILEQGTLFTMRMTGDRAQLLAIAQSVRLAGANR